MPVPVVSGCMLVKLGSLKVDDIHRLVRNDNAMLGWICSTKLCKKIPISDLRTRMSVSSIEDIRYNRFHWFGHLQRMDEEKWPRKFLNFEVNGSYPQGHPRKKWLNNIRSDLINCDYQLLWLKIVVNGEMQSNHPDMLQCPTLVFGEKKENKLDSK